MRVPIALGILLLVGLACAHALQAQAQPGQHSRLDPRLRRLAETHPDSVVAASIEFTRAPTRGDLARIRRAGLGVTRVSGVFVNVRGRASVFGAVARLSSVQYIQISRPLRTQDSGVRSRISPTSGGIE